MTEAQAYAQAKDNCPQADVIRVYPHNDTLWVAKCYEKYSHNELELVAKYTMPRTKDPA